MSVMASPGTIDIAITHRCNLKCKYCSHFTSAGDVDRDLPLEGWLRFFEELNRSHIMNITIGGGEPFYREDLKEIIDGIVRNRMRFRILSNGTLITPEMASFLASTRRCDDVQVSIDGSMPMTHDYARGSGNFFKAIEGIKNLKESGLPASVRVTIHKKNLMDLEETAKLLLEDLNLPGFSTNSASYMGLCRQNAEQLQLSTEERTLAMETLLKLNIKYNQRINASAGPLAEAKNWNIMEKSRRKGETLPGRGYLTGCGVGSSKMAVRADGVMVPCLQISHIELGRINKDGLIEVWQNKHPELKKLRARRNISLREFEFCKGCEYIDYCTGNCPAIAYAILGDMYHPSPDACLKRFLDDGGQLPAEELLIETAVIK